MSTAALRVVIVGGGVGGLEALLALHALAGERCALTLVAPEADFVYRPLAVGEPFALGATRRHPLAAIARDTAATLVRGALADVDPEARTIGTDLGERLDYDALVVALGAASSEPYEHAMTWDPGADAQRLNGLLRDVEQGYTRRVAFVVPPGPGWPLPAYELALLTANQAYGTASGVEITLVTPESAPLAIFGPRPSAEVAAELERAGIVFEGGIYAEVERGHAATVLLRPGDRRLEVDRVVALPRLAGRRVRGLPADADGFVPVDGHGRVTGLQHVWAAGDGIDFPVKFGGLAAQQADAAAADIAARAGAAVTPEAFRPVLRGRLLTGHGSRWMRYDASGGGGEGTIADHALWWPPTKVAGLRLAPYLESRDESAFVAPEPADVGVAVQVDLHREL